MRDLWVGYCCLYQVSNLIIPLQCIVLLNFQRFIYMVTNHHVEIFVFLHALFFRSIFSSTVSIYCAKTVVWEKYLPPLLMLSSLAFPHRFHIAAATSFPSVMFSILTSNGLCTFTKTHKIHFSCSVPSKSVQVCHVLHHTHTEDSLHRLPKNVHHLNSTIPSGFSHPSLLFSNNCSPSKNFAFSIILLFVPYSYTHHLSPLSPTSLSPTFPLPTPFFLTITYSTVRSYQFCPRKKPITG